LETTKVLLQDGFLDGHVAMRSLADRGKFYMAKAVSSGKIAEKDIQIFFIKNGEPADDSDPAEASAERYVHAAIFAARPDIKCSIHTHAAALKTLSSTPMIPGQSAAPHHHPSLHYPQPMWQASLQNQMDEQKRVMSHQVVTQIEFYLGDQNLPYDAYLLNQMQKLNIKARPAREGKSQESKEDIKTDETTTISTGRAWVPLELLIGFKRMQMILSIIENKKEVRVEAVASALESSKLLQLSENRKYVRRRHSLPSVKN